MRSAEDLDIIPECYIDTALITTMLKVSIGTSGVNHQKGCNNVVNAMKGKYGDGFALGIMDEDKRQPGYLKEFTLIAFLPHLKLLKHNTKPHFVLHIAPAMDKFILETAAIADIQVESFGFPASLKEFIKITKVENPKPECIERFRRLFKSFQHTKEMVTLQNVLSYLKQHKYDFDLKTLQSYF